jgi:assimilatory nitrate reductase catalytic subunit
VVLPSTVWAEDEGLMTNGEGRVIKHNKAVEPPGKTRTDWEIVCELARRLGSGDKFPFRSPAEILDELRVASKGGVADYYGITYEKVEATGGVFWPCPTLDHPGHAAPVRGRPLLPPRRQGPLHRGRVAAAGRAAR